MRRRLRIGIFTHNYPANSKDRKDAGIFIYDFSQMLSEYADVFVFCPDSGGKKEDYKKVPVKWFDWKGGKEKFGNWKLFNPWSIYKFFKLVYVGQKEAISFAREKKLDYCLCCWALPSAIFGLRVKQILGTSYSTWSLGSDVNKYTKIPVLGQLIFWALKESDKLYANSYSLCDKVNKLTGRKCHFLPAITNFKLGKVDSPKINKNKFNFLFVGRLESIKGVDILVKAAKLINKDSDFVIHILGDGSLRKELEDKSREIKNKINFVGWADEAKVGGYMKLCDFLVIPSRSESLPLVMIEAAKVNLPMIVTNVGDCARIVNKYKIGVVVEKESVEGLAKAMQKVIDGEIEFSRKATGFNLLTRDFSQKKAVVDFVSQISK